MMYHLTQDQLAHIIFPLGRVCKKDTRRMAEERNLPVAHKAESQDICFLTNGSSYTDFLKKRAPKTFKPGELVDTKGRILGKHRGLPYYTIGQRKGLGISAPFPLYVTALDAERNRVVVGRNEDLFRRKLLADDLAFTDGAAPAAHFRCEAKIRYGMRTNACEVQLQADGRAAVLFDEPQRAVTAGQSVVFYDGERLIGGGTIVRGL